jgi:large subunit ribosomal protein L6
MSRIGKLPITIPKGVEINVDKGNVVTVKGKLGVLKQKVDPDISIEIEGEQLTVKRPSEQKRHRSMHGLYRSLINNMVVGVSEGFTVKLEMVGVGYRASTTGQQLDISVGYSHNILFEFPTEIKVDAVTEKRANPIITIASYDKHLLGQVTAKIRSYRMPEPYKGKGIKFVGEVLRRKAGKSATSK